MLERAEKEYRIVIGGREVGRYKSDRYYHEFENPFFAAFPQYKDVILDFDHIDLVISDKVRQWNRLRRREN